MRSILFLFIFLMTGLLTKAQPVPNPKDILLEDKLIGKWKYIRDGDKLFPAWLEFGGDLIAKIASPVDSLGHSSIGTYNYSVRGGAIRLISAKGDMQIQIEKLTNDTLHLYWYHYSSLRLDYYRVK